MKTTNFCLIFRVKNGILIYDNMMTRMREDFGPLSIHVYQDCRKMTALFYDSLTTIEYGGRCTHVKA